MTSFDLQETSSSNWPKIMSAAITDPAELLKLLELDPLSSENTLLDRSAFPLRVPRGFAARMKKGDWHDPLLRQVLPVQNETRIASGFSTDPLQEALANPIPGLLHKYAGRVLLTTVGACAVHCRYCFRRHFPYEKNNPGAAGWEKALQYIDQNPTINEVILSGGDPLVARDDYLGLLIRKIEAIPHVKTLRIHTRLPIVIPERVTDDLLKNITDTRLRSVLVVHCNHAQEIDDTVIQAMKKFHCTPVTLLNQSVLLKDVNNTIEDLVQLSEALFDAGILPYYLHLLDKVQGAAHFEVSQKAAKNLIHGIRQKLPGYLVPRLVRETPGGFSKIPV